MRHNEEKRALLSYWAKQLSIACESHGVYVGSPFDYIDNSDRIRETLDKVKDAFADLDRVN